ncbi:MAG: response regulator [Deltaproteobacteria bacterium]|nr:response regulator [Deltaproteobacteria bacterium]
MAGRRSVSSLVALKLVFVVVVSCLIPIPVVYLTTRSEWNGRLQQHAEEMVESLARSLELPLWEIDEEGRRSVVRAYVESGAAARVRVWDTDGTLLEDWGDSRRPDLVVRRRTVRHEGIEVGTVEVGVSPRFMVSAGRRILWSNVLVMLVVALSIAGGAFLLVGRHIRRPLEALGQALDRLAEGDYDFDPGDRMPWEFRNVIERFRRMARRIREREAALAEVNRRLEHEVEERVRAEERYRALFENAVEGMFVSTPDGRYLAVNPALAELYGYDSPEELRGSVRDIRTDVCVFPEQRDEFLALLERHDVVRNFEMKARRRDGKRLDLLVSARAGRGPDGRIETIQGFVLDVTQQRVMEAQVLHAQKMEAVGTLAGGVAHDFNNLLQAVLGYAELLLEARPDDPGLVRGLEGIRRAALRGRSLTDQLLAFSRRAPEEAGVGDRKPLDLNRAIRSVFDLLRRTLPRMIQVDLDLEEPLWKVRADPVQVEQVLMNLALNAKDAMPDGGTLTVRTRNVRLGAQADPDDPPELPPGRYVRVSLSDTGHGMPAHVLEHIFEPFFTTKEVGQGTGLGLSSVYGIVKGHGGTVTCESTAGKGTTFHVFLPAGGEPLRPEAGPGPGPGAPSPAGAGTVLLVDDEESVREVCREVLGRAGYGVIAVPDGETALEVYREQGDRLDLVILDLNMPGMGGERCLEELLRLDPSVRVIVATGYLDAGSPEDLCGARAVEVLRKPYRSADLLRAVQRALEDPPPSRSPA